MERVQRLIQAGQELLDAQRFPQAARCFEEAVAVVLGGGGEPSGRLLANWGYTLALGLKEYDRGLEICRKAVGKDPSNPDLLSMLGDVYLACGDKFHAYRAFSEGLRQDPGHSGMQEHLLRLGVRRTTPVRFLPRRHFLNRTLGRLRSEYPYIFGRI